MTDQVTNNIDTITYKERKLTLLGSGCGFYAGLLLLSLKQTFLLFYANKKRVERNDLDPHRLRK